MESIELRLESWERETVEERIVELGDKVVPVVVVRMVAVAADIADFVAVDIAGVVARIAAVEVAAAAAQTARHGCRAL